MKSILKVLTICIFISSSALAQVEQDSSLTIPNSPRSEFKHAINICPIAPIFGFYSINYEYLISPKNGFVARFDYEDVPKTYTDASIESSGIGFTLNYRRHFSEEMNSLFLGAYTRYRIYKGSGELDLEKIDLTLQSFSIGLNAGKRWAWDSGFNIVISLGYGFDINNSETNPDDGSFDHIVDQFKKEYEFMSPFYGEFSIGYAF
jgi:hypothetical protein